MPGLDGYEVIKKLPGENRPYVIAVTGYGQPADRARTRAAGFDDHLVKPVKPDRLLNILAAIPCRKTSERGSV